MTGFNSTDDFVSEVTTNGKFWRTDWMKILTPSATLTAGRWHELEGFGGNPVQRLAGNMVLNGDLMSTSLYWTLGSANCAYTPATHLLTRTANADVSTVSQNTLCVPGQVYTVLYTATRSAGSITVSLGGTNGTARSAAGTFREEIVCGTTANAPLVFTPDATFAGTIDLISVTRQYDFVPYNNSSENAMYMGPAPSGTDTKHIVNMGAWNNALLGSPAVLMLVDVLGVYPSIKSNTAIPQVFTSLTRIRNGEFAGNATGWTLGSNWAYGSNGVTRTSAADTATLSIAGVHIQENVPYRLTYTLSGCSGAGTVTPSLSDVSGTARTTDGTYTDILTPTTGYDVGTAGGSLTFTPTSGNWGGKITAVSLCPMVPRYTDGAGVRAFMSTAYDTLPGANAQTLSVQYLPADPTYSIANSCDAITNWTGTGDATLTINNTTYMPSGTGSLNVAKTGATVVNTIATNPSCTSINFLGKKLQMWFYCKDATAYAKLAAAVALTVKYGSDSSNYYTYNFSKAQLGRPDGLGIGWQKLEMFQNAPATTTGTPNTSAFVYFQANIQATTSGTVWAAGDFMIDDIKVCVNGSYLGATVANTASSIASHIVHSGVAAQNYGPFLPMQAGDTSIMEVESVTLSAASAAAGTFNVYLVKPLATIPLPVGFVASERDLMNQIPSLPKVHKNACLAMLMFAGAATITGTQVQGFLDFAWG